MLTSSGLNAVAAGNIGTALSAVADRQWDALVIEVSSFQLRFIDAFHPQVAAITNVAPDHLDWHGSFEAYLGAKKNIHRNQRREDTLVFDTDDEGAVACIEGAASTLVPVSGRLIPPGGSGPDGDQLVIDGLRFPLPELDGAYLSDLAIAGVMARRLGATASGIGSVIHSFSPGAHRRQLVGRWGGVQWINDSKATNPHAAVAAVSAYDSVILIAGGRNKGLDLSPMADVPSLRRILAIGEATEELEKAAPALVVRQADLASAVEAAAEMAHRGDTVLLAPGCASFDMYESYIARGRHFVDLVNALHEGQNR
jgi:UDP-N-acetylmuramoylalanine--D-glutamate ligase